MQRSILALIACVALFAVSPLWADDSPLPEIAPVDELPIPPLDAPAEDEFGHIKKPKPGASVFLCS